MSMCDKYFDELLLGEDISLEAMEHYRQCPECQRLISLSRAIDIGMIEIAEEARNQGDCPKASLVAEAFYQGDGVLPDDLKEHVISCASCTMLVLDMKAVEAELADPDSHVDLPESLAQELAELRSGGPGAVASDIKAALGKGEQASQQGASGEASYGLAAAPLDLVAPSFDDEDDDGDEGDEEAG